jgi:hypothetical protein
MYDFFHESKVNQKKIEEGILMYISSQNTIYLNNIFFSLSLFFFPSMFFFFFFKFQLHPVILDLLGIELHIVFQFTFYEVMSVS